MSRITFDGQRLRIEDIVALARRQAGAELGLAPEFQARIQAGADFVARAMTWSSTLEGCE